MSIYKQYGVCCVRHTQSSLRLDSNSDSPDHSQLVTNYELDRSAMGPNFFIIYFSEKVEVKEAVTEAAEETVKV